MIGNKKVTLFVSCLLVIFGGILIFGGSKILVTGKLVVLKYGLIYQMETSEKYIFSAMLLLYGLTLMVTQVKHILDILKGNRG